ncbi:MAG: hypothetical protein Q4P11_00130 [Methanobrevibacter sp.]|nr:hypothetical protein [Methanobrevibacter sp.]
MIFMTNMYKDIKVKVSENIKINGHPFYAENISSDEAYNRRELNRNSILGGTEAVTKGRYIPRSYNFTTTIYHPTNRPDYFEKVLKGIVSNPAEVISPYMGGKFKAEVIIQKNIEESSPNHMVLDFTVTEIPNKKSNIPGEKFTVPKPKKVKVSTSSTSKKSSSKKSKSKKQSKKGK